jgi:hypothetical protein
MDVLSRNLEDLFIPGSSPMLERVFMHKKYRIYERNPKKNENEWVSADV